MRQRLNIDCELPEPVRAIAEALFDVAQREVDPQRSTTSARRRQMPTAIGVFDPGIQQVEITAG
ncbi:hypothetical protein [Methylocystis parvus]|uniref:hypothetical protein n=1 Tax=Methylocystis parvus TaxID=134 RepID=UPI003C78AB61